MTTAFGKIRTIMWPIHRKELRVFLPMFLMNTLICFNYSLLRIIKDPIVTTAPGSGADVIPFLKVGAILPMALLATYVFTRLANKYSQEKIFYVLVSSFLAFFVIYMTLLYPFQDTLHLHRFADFLETVLPSGFRGLISSVRNWTGTLFYVMAELWSTTIMSVLFWGFANHITPVSDAKRYYAIFGVGANLATVFAGTFPAFITTYHIDFSFIFGADTWGRDLANITLLVVISGLITMGLFRWYNKNVLKEGLLPNSPMTAEEAKSGQKKIKMGLKKNFLYLAKSKYLMNIAIIVLTYNIAMNMIEVVWKDQVNIMFDHSTEKVAVYHGKVTTIMASIATVVGLFFTSATIRKFGWTVSALVTPLIIFVSGALFFSCILIKDSQLGLLAAANGLSPVVLACFFGSTQQCLTRASKYTFFDATKEISFIPLSRECKLKGKAAIDGVGSRLGKSGGSFLHIILLSFFGPAVSASAPIAGIILLFVIVAYIFATRSLGKQFNEVTAQNEKIDVEEPTPQKGKEVYGTVQ